MCARGSIVSPGGRGGGKAVAINSSSDIKRPGRASTSHRTCGPSTIVGTYQPDRKDTASRAAAAAAGTSHAVPSCEGVAVKKVLELLLCILHPVAVVLIWLDLVLRDDIGVIARLTWAIAAIVPLVPFVYVLTGNDFI